MNEPDDRPPRHNGQLHLIFSPGHFWDQERTVVAFSKTSLCVPESYAMPYQRRASDITKEGCLL